jgi:hypothetical protein
MPEENKQKLQKLLQEQQKLEAELGKFRSDVSGLKRDLATAETTGLLQSLKNLSELFTSGAVFKVFVEIKQKLKALQDYDPQWPEQFKTDKPYGINIKGDESLKFYADHILNSNAPAVFEGGLDKLMDRLLSTKNYPGNPLKTQKGK